MTGRNAARKLKRYIENNGGLSDGSHHDFGWYTGIASNPAARLIEDHNVNEKNGLFLFVITNSDTEARRAERDLIRYGCEGGSGGGNWDSKYVYAYKISIYTKE